MNVTIEVPSRLIPASLTAPVSKSDAQRALVLAHLLGVSAGVPDDAELPRDVRVLSKGLASLSRIPCEIDCADGGAPFRFLLTQAAVTPGSRVLFRGTPRLAERPHSPLIDSLRRTLGPVGLELRQELSWPYAVAGARGRAPRPVFEIDAAQSSQFASSLLLGCASLAIRERRTWSVALTGAVASAGYLDLTVQWLKRAGFAVIHRGAQLDISAPSGLAEPFQVPSDWSSAAYLLLLAWRCGGSIENAPNNSQPDSAIVELLERTGLRTEGDSRVTGVPSTGLMCSVAAHPDLAPTLAAFSLVLPSRTVLSDCAILRGKESDRLAGLMALVTAFGGDAELAGDAVTLTPGSSANAEVHYDCDGDHRLAMSAATAAILTGRTLHLRGAEAVEKSFPGYWTQVARSGVKLLFTE